MYALVSVSVYFFLLKVFIHVFAAGLFTISCVTVTYHLDVGLPIQICTYTTRKSAA